MPMKTDTDLDIKLAVYMERLDSYIDSQTKLNESICSRVEKVNEELDELKHWRTKIYGVKSSVVVLSLIMMHTGMILGSVFAMMTWFSNR